jgi:hypothetical protein
MMTKKTIALVAALAALTACDNDGIGADPPASLAGTWSYSIYNLREPGLNCDMTGAVLHLTQSGTTLSGMLDVGDAQVECTLNTGGDYEPTAGSGEVTGSYQGGEVEISEDLLMGEQVVFTRIATGSAEGNQVSGTVTVVETDLSGNLHELTGTFRLRKQ